jgi:hypothetical protein
MSVYRLAQIGGVLSLSGTGVGVGVGLGVGVGVWVGVGVGVGVGENANWRISTRCVATAHTIRGIDAARNIKRMKRRSRKSPEGGLADSD